MGASSISFPHESITKYFAGWIEPADKSWIIYLDADGRPDVYFANRDADGGVIGEGLPLK